MLPAEPLYLWREVKWFGFSRIPASLSQCLPVLWGHAHPLVFCPGEAGALSDPSSQLTWKAGEVLSAEGHVRILIWGFFRWKSLSHRSCFGKA